MFITLSYYYLTKTKNMDQNKKPIIQVIIDVIACGLVYLSFALICYCEALFILNLIN